MNIEKEICLYAASKSDFRAAKKAAELLIKYIRENNISESMAHSDPIYSALHCALVVCYTKPFGKNNPEIRLVINEIAPHLNTDQTQLHQDLVDMRDKCVAHSDHEFRNTTIYPPGSHGDNQSFYVQIKNRGFSPHKINEILSLAIRMEEIIDLIYPSKIIQLHTEKGKPSEPYQLTP